MMPDYRQSKLISMRKKEKLEARPFRQGTMQVEDYRRAKGRSDA